MQSVPLWIEGPARDQVLHLGVARAEAVLLVEQMSLLDLGHVELHAEAGLPRHFYQAALDLQRLLGEALAVLTLHSLRRR